MQQSVYARSKATLSNEKRKTKEEGKLKLLTRRTNTIAKELNKNAIGDALASKALVTVRIGGLAGAVVDQSGVFDKLLSEACKVRALTQSGQTVLASVFTPTGSDGLIGRLRQQNQDLTVQLDREAKRTKVSEVARSKTWRSLGAPYLDRKFARERFEQELLTQLLPWSGPVTVQRRRAQLQTETSEPDSEL
jgi:hypothetical protein